MTHRLTRFELGFLSIIVIIGAALRCMRISESLWYDEVAAWSSYGVHGPKFIVSTFHDPSNHIFHTLSSWLSVTLTADFLSAELSLRLPAFLASLIAIPVVFAMARRVAGRDTAMAAAALMAVWPVCVLEGAEARGYSMMMLFSALATWQLLVALQSRRLVHWLLYALWCALGAWTHMVTVFVAIGHGAWLASRLYRQEERRQATAGLLALVAAAVMTLLLYAPVLPEIVVRRGIASAANSSQPRPIGPEGMYMLLQLGGSWLWYAALPMLALVVLGVVVALRSEDRRMRDATALSLAGMPIFVAVVLLANAWMYARFALFTMPGAALAAAIGWTWLRNRAPLLALIPAFFVLAISTWEIATRPPKQPLREAVEYMLDQDGAGSRVLLVSIAHPVLDAYVPGTITSFNLGATLEEDLAKAKPAWVVVLYPEHVAPDKRALLEALGYAQAARFDGWVDWGKGDVVVYRKSTSHSINK